MIKLSMWQMITYGIYAGKTIKQVSKIDPWWLLREYEKGKIKLSERALIVIECEIAEQSD